MGLSERGLNWERGLIRAFTVYILYHWILTLRAITVLLYTKQILKSALYEWCTHTCTVR